MARTTDRRERDGMKKAGKRKQPTLDTAVVPSDQNQPSESKRSSPPITSDTTRIEIEEGLIICGICLDTLYNPQNVSPCNHKFCSGCIYEWQSRNKFCPKCRWRISDMTRDPFVDSVIEQYLKTYPDKARTVTSKTELDEMELRHLKDWVGGRRIWEDDGRNYFEVFADDDDSLYDDEYDEMSSEESALEVGEDEEEEGDYDEEDEEEEDIWSMFSRDSGDSQDHQTDMLQYQARRAQEKQRLDKLVAEKTAREHRLEQQRLEEERLRKELKRKNKQAARNNNNNNNGPCPVVGLRGSASVDVPATEGNGRRRRANRH